MNNLITKAVQAIRDGKTEYAIGLLEGILEINSIPTTTAIPVPTVKPVHIAPTGEGAMLDSMAAAKLEDIKRSANIEMV